MARMVVVRVKKDPTKGSEVKVFGVKGGGCQTLTADIVNKLGGVRSTTPTDEMQQQPQQDEQISQEA